MVTFSGGKERKTRALLFLVLLNQISAIIHRSRNGLGDKSSVAQLMNIYKITCHFDTTVNMVLHHNSHHSG